jgi:tRNA-Thr(GGU) m(6)t(6)A37 methyltransferase TsaA
MIPAEEFAIRPIGTVQSELVNRRGAPRQDTEGAPSAWLVLDPEMSVGLDGITPGQEICVLTWFHLAARDVLQVHPRGNLASPLRGVFSTRSPERPNPIGLHQVKVEEIRNGREIRVDHLDAVDGTPIVDLKPALRR